MFEKFRPWTLKMWFMVILFHRLSPTKFASFSPFFRHTVRQLNFAFYALQKNRIISLTYSDNRIWLRDVQNPPPLKACRFESGPRYHINQRLTSNSDVGLFLCFSAKDWKSPALVIDGKSVGDPWDKAFKIDLASHSPLVLCGQFCTPLERSALRHYIGMVLGDFGREWRCAELVKWHPSTGFLQQPLSYISSSCNIHHHISAKFLCRNSWIYVFFKFMDAFV